MKKEEKLNNLYLEAKKTNDTLAINLLFKLKDELEHLLICSNGPHTTDQIIEGIAKSMTNDAIIVNTVESKLEIELLKPFLKF